MKTEYTIFEALRRKLKSIKKAKISQKISSISKFEKSDYHNLKLELDLKNYAQNIELRNKYAKWIFIMVCIWLFIILSIICFQAVGCFNLSDAVLITLISTTTANVAIYFLRVIRYLFPETG